MSWEKLSFSHQLFHIWILSKNHWWLCTWIPTYNEASKVSNHTNNRLILHICGSFFIHRNVLEYRISYTWYVVTFFLIIMNTTQFRSHASLFFWSHVTHEVIYKLLNFLQILNNFSFILKTLETKEFCYMHNLVYVYCYNINITFTNLIFKFSCQLTYINIIC